MKKSSLNIGDVVLRCLQWKPGIEGVRSGKGLVTLIAEKDGDSRFIRVLWRNGEFEWHPERELVNVKNVKRFQEVGSRGSD